MPTLHDPNVFASIRSRLETLLPDASARWGRMTVDQMLWHVNQSMEQCVGRLTLPRRRKPLPSILIKWLVLNSPWTRHAPTNSNFVAKTRHDFGSERSRAVRLMDEIAQRDINAPWPPNADFGPMCGKDWSRLQAKHLDHHLRQFGA